MSLLIFIDVLLQKFKFQKKNFFFLDGSWDIANPTIISLGVQSVMCLSEVDGSLWCASGIHILILDTYTLGIKVKA